MNLSRSGRCRHDGEALQTEKELQVYAHVRRFTLFLAGRLLSPFAVRGSFLENPVDRSSEGGR